MSLGMRKASSRVLKKSWFWGVLAPATIGIAVAGAFFRQVELGADRAGGTARDGCRLMGQPQRAIWAAGSGCGHRADNQTIAVLHQRMAHEAQPRFLTRSFAKQAGLGIGRRTMRVVAPPLAVEVPLAIAARIGRLARAVLGAKAFQARPGFEQCAVDREMLARQQRLDLVLR